MVSIDNRNIEIIVTFEREEIDVVASSDAPIEVDTTIDNGAQYIDMNELAKYQLERFDFSNNIYAGYSDKDGNWYIAKIDIDSGTKTYAKGFTGFELAWGTRASLIYDDYSNVF